MNSRRKSTHRGRERKQSGYYIPVDSQPSPNFVQPYSPSIFDSVSSGHGTIAHGTGHGNAGRGLGKLLGGGKKGTLRHNNKHNNHPKRRRRQRSPSPSSSSQCGGSAASPTLSDTFSGNVSYFDTSSGVSGFHPSFFDGVYSGHGTSSFTTAHSTGGLGLGKYDQIGYGRTDRSKVQRKARSPAQRGGSTASPTLSDTFSGNVSYFDSSSGVSGFHPSFFEGVYSGHGTSSFSTAHSTGGLGLGKYDQIGYGGGDKIPSLWEYLNLDPHDEKEIEDENGQRNLRFSNLYWFPGPTFAMFEVDFQDGDRHYTGDGVITDEGGKRVIRGRLISCLGGQIQTIPLWNVLSEFFDQV